MLAPIATGNRYAPGRIEFSGERLVNYLFEPGEGVSAGQCLGREGHTPFATLSAGNPVRGITTMGGDLYASCGGALYKVTTAAAVANMGVLPNAHTRMAANSTQVGIVANSTYYCLSGGAITAPTVGAIPSGVSDIAFADQYFILSGDTGSRADAITVSALNDGTTFSALDVAFSEDEPDPIVAIQKQGQYVWLLNQRSYEVFQNTGAAAFPWEPTGTFSGEDGCKSRESVVSTNNIILWVRGDGAVMAAPDYVPQKVSPSHIQEIFGENDVTDAMAFTDRGHDVAVWRFSDRPALAYDLTTGQWAEYATGEDLDAFFITCSVRLGNVEYLGTSTGKIVKKARETYDDDGAVIKAQATSQPLDQGGRYFSVPRLYINMRGGVGGLGRTPKAYIEVSKDGRTWGAPKERDLGDAGDYYKRGVWNALGAFRRFQFRVTVTDAVPRDILGVQVG